MAALYRHYDKDGILLYIGVSLNAITRLGQHHGKPWFSSIKRVEVQPFESREAALHAEIEAIAREKPKFNIRGFGKSRSTAERYLRRLNWIAPPSWVRKIDDWRRRQADVPNLSEAIRRLVEIALELEKKSGKRGC